MMPSCVPEGDRANWASHPLAGSRALAPTAAADFKNSRREPPLLQSEASFSGFALIVLPLPCGGPLREWTTAKKFPGYEAAQLDILGPIYHTNAAAAEFLHDTITR